MVESQGTLESPVFRSRGCANPDYVALTQGKGHAIHIWTVDSSADVTFLAALGVDAIISNRPRMVRSVLQKVGASG
jgi:glycerophosphoryl diester phosphodiesterase